MQGIANTADLSLGKSEYAQCYRWTSALQQPPIAGIQSGGKRLVYDLSAEMCHKRRPGSDCAAASIDRHSVSPLRSSALQEQYTPAKRSSSPSPNKAFAQYNEAVNCDPNWKPRKESGHKRKSRQKYRQRDERTKHNGFKIDKLQLEEKENCHPFNGESESLSTQRSSRREWSKPSGGPDDSPLRFKEEFDAHNDTDNERSHKQLKEKINHSQFMRDNEIDDFEARCQIALNNHDISDKSEYQMAFASMPIRSSSEEKLRRRPFAAAPGASLSEYQTSYLTSPVGGQFTGDCRVPAGIPTRYSEADIVVTKKTSDIAASQPVRPRSVQQQTIKEQMRSHAGIVAGPLPSDALPSKSSAGVNKQMRENQLESTSSPAKRPVYEEKSEYQRVFHGGDQFPVSELSTDIAHHERRARKEKKKTPVPKVNASAPPPESCYLPIPRAGPRCDNGVLPSSANEAAGDRGRHLTEYAAVYTATALVAQTPHWDANKRPYTAPAQTRTKQNQPITSGFNIGSSGTNSSRLMSSATITPRDLHIPAVIAESSADITSSNSVPKITRSMPAKKPSDRGNKGTCVSAVDDNAWVEDLMRRRRLARQFKRRSFDTHIWWWVDNGGRVSRDTDSERSEQQKKIEAGSQKKSPERKRPHESSVQALTSYNTRANERSSTGYRPVEVSQRVSRSAWEGDSMSPSRTYSRGGTPTNEMDKIVSTSSGATLTHDGAVESGRYTRHPVPQSRPTAGFSTPPGVGIQHPSRPASNTTNTSDRRPRYVDYSADTTTDHVTSYSNHKSPPTTLYTRNDAPHFQDRPLATTLGTWAYSRDKPSLDENKSSDQGHYRSHYRQEAEGGTGFKSGSAPGTQRTSSSRGTYRMPDKDVSDCDDDGEDSGDHMERVGVSGAGFRGLDMAEIGEENRQERRKEIIIEDRGHKSSGSSVD